MIIKIYPFGETLTEQRMTFFDHIDEFRRRLLIIVITLLITSSIGYYFAMDILGILKQQLPAITLTYRGIMEPFMVKFKLGVLTGFFLALPIVLYEVLAFLAPALKGKEKRIIYPMVFLLVVLFFAGAIFSYFYIIPIGVEWLLVQDEGKLVRLLNVSDFISFITLFILAFGVAFETPVALMALIKLKIVSRESLRKNWRVAYITLLVIAAIATPDWSLPPMLILGTIMILLYELTLFMVRWW